MREMGKAVRKRGEKGKTLVLQDESKGYGKIVE